MADKGHSDEVSGGNEEHVIEQLMKGYPCLKVTKNLDKSSCFSVL